MLHHFSFTFTSLISFSFYIYIVYIVYIIHWHIWFCKSICSRLKHSPGNGEIWSFPFWACLVARVVMVSECLVRCVESTYTSLI